MYDYNLQDLEISDYIAELGELGQDTIENLSEYDYFTARLFGKDFTYFNWLENKRSMDAWRKDILIA